MTLKSRLLILLVIMLGMLAAGLALLDRLQRMEERHTADSIAQDRTELLERVLPLIQYPLQQFANDYSLWDEMLKFVTTADPEWGRINVDASLNTFKLAAIWVFAPDGTQVYAVKQTDIENLPALPDMKTKLLPALRAKPFRQFYLRADNALYAVQAAPIQPSDDLNRTTAPAGWLVAARQLDGNYLRTVAELSGATVELRNSATLPSTEKAQPGHVEVLRELRDIDGQIIAALRLDYQPWLLTNEYNRDEALLMVGLLSLLIATTIVCLQIWVLKPFEIISRSLVLSNPEGLKPLLTKTSEIGHVARLIRIHFAHLRALNQTMEDRARLARDLHDGVIQSIYAAGMGLAAAQSSIKHNPDAARQQLEEIRGALNETIREARSFIAGLESSDIQSLSFARTVESLVESMKWIWQAKIDVNINDAAADELSASTKAEALKIIREALSNSLRHGHAHNVKIGLRQTVTGAELTIDDDGAGFDPAATKSGGHGLTNMHERAQSVGATAHVESSRGKGTRVNVTFSRAHRT